jgi:hypothetical protein
MPPGSGLELCLVAGPDATGGWLLSADDGSVAALDGSGCWYNGESQRCADIGPIPTPKRWLVAARGSDVVVGGDVSSVEATVSRLVETNGVSRLRPVQRFDLADRRDRVHVEPGRYVLDVYGTWEQGEQTFYFGLVVGE